MPLESAGRKIRFFYKKINFYILKYFSAANRISKDISNILTKLKLKKLYSAIVLKYDKETFGMLTLIEPYITWG